jgi:hypothetical protein
VARTEIRFDKLADITPLRSSASGWRRFFGCRSSGTTPAGGDTLAKCYVGKEIPDFLGYGWRPLRGGGATSPATDGPVQPTDDVDEIYDQEAV